MKLFRTLACLLILVVPALAQAHTGLKESVPADGAVVKTPPASINLVFTADVRLIKFEVVAPDHEMPTKFEANTETHANYAIETPGMHPGSFTVNWAVIGEDGHTVTNSFAFTVDPSAEDSAAP